MHYLQVQQEVDSLAKIHQREILLVVVSKKRTIEEIRTLYDMGCRHFGENRLDEALEKMEALPKDINWHMIGKIQSKKVSKVVAAKFFLIHSVDSVDLAEKISKESVKHGCITSILLQANTSGEETKHGLPIEAWKEHFDEVAALPSIEIRGWMTMAPLTEDMERIRKSFETLRVLRDSLATDQLPMPELSMGMSHDYWIAIHEGATMVRVGTNIFE